MWTKKGRAITAIIAFAVFIIINILLFKHKEYNYMRKKSTGPITTAELPKLKEIFIDKLEYIEANSGIFRPYSSEQLKVIKERAKSSNITLNSLAQLNLLTPNTHLDYEPISKPPGCPLNTTCFQFTQGISGWYWLYGTFIDPDGSVSSYMFYLIRLELAPNTILRKADLKPGEGALYYISGGVGRGHKWVYSPYMYVRGTYNCMTESTFSFEALDMPNNGICKMSSATPTQFSILCKWVDPETKNTYGFNVKMNSNELPYYNTPDGCAPCIGGDGTLYWSYTNLQIHGELFVNNRHVVNNGIGWMDHQWGGSYLQPLYVRLIFNIQRLFSMRRYLGRYLWLNVHLPDKHYLVYTFPPSRVKKNDLFDKVTVNQYSASRDTEYNLWSRLTVLETVSVDNVDYPVKYKLQIGEENYILDSKRFGNTVTLDPTGNLHWSGSALLYDEGVKRVGTAFFEANQLQDPTDFLRVQLKNAKIDEKYLPIFDVKHLAFLEVLPSILVSLLYVVVFIFLIISIYRLVRFKKVNNSI
jgi:hypothetical protein